MPNYRRLDELDLHGMTVDEAIPAVDVFLHKAYRQHYLRVFIIHGKGTGTLKKACRNFFEQCSIVDSYYDADIDHGADGATEVWFIPF